MRVTHVTVLKSSSLVLNRPACVHYSKPGALHMSNEDLERDFLENSNYATTFKDIKDDL